MNVYLYTDRWIFKCTQERERLSCLKFDSNGQFFRVIAVYRAGGKYYVIDDKNVTIQVSDTPLNVMKQYISKTYGKIENVVTQE